MTRLNSSRRAAGLVIACVLTFTMAASILAQEKVETDHLSEAGSSDTEPEISAFKFASTDSPRDTLSSFVRLTWLLESAMLNYQEEQFAQTDLYLSISDEGTKKHRLVPPFFGASQVGVRSNSERLTVEAFAGGDFFDWVTAQLRELLHRLPQRHQGTYRVFCRDV